MKTLITLLLLLPLAVYGQTYEYCTYEDWGRGSRNFEFGSKYDSTKAYGKFKDVVDALDFASKRGWELVHITASGDTHRTMYIFRRRIQQPTEGDQE